MTVGKGLKVNLFADEKKFPELAKPVQMAWDTKGRLWVAVWPSYPHWKPNEPMNDKLLIFEDTDGDGKADKMTVFADDLHNPTGFEFYNGGVLVAQAPDLMFLKDTNGDDKADVRERIVSRPRLRRHAPHGQQLRRSTRAARCTSRKARSTTRRSKTPYGPPKRLRQRRRVPLRAADAEVRRRTSPTASPTRTATSSTAGARTSSSTAPAPTRTTRALFSGHLDYPNKHSRPPQVYQQRTRPCPGMEFLSSRHFPRSARATCSSPTCIGFQGILRYKISDDGGELRGHGGRSRSCRRTDPNFRPSDLKIGPDGALYFIDWHNPIIGHMQHNLRDPSRDREHGRIYRVTYEGRQLLEAGEDRRRADREAARPAEGARGPRPLPRADRTGRPARPRR